MAWCDHILLHLVHAKLQQSVKAENAKSGHYCTLSSQVGGGGDQKRPKYCVRTMLLDDPSSQFYNSQGLQWCAWFPYAPMHISNIDLGSSSHWSSSLDDLSLSQLCKECSLIWWIKCSSWVVAECELIAASRWEQQVHPDWCNSFLITVSW